jgi:hypothetical protein
MTSPADEELLEYTLTSPSLRLQDVVKKHNLMPYMDDIVSVAKHLLDKSWGCVLVEVLDIDQNTVTDLVSAMEVMELE